MAKKDIAAEWLRDNDPSYGKRKNPHT